MRVRIVEIEFDVPVMCEECDAEDVYFVDDLWDNEDVDVENPVWVEMLNRRFNEIS